MICDTDHQRKVMIIAHGHPDHAKGGGEIAAYNLHRQLKTTTEFDSVFLARHHRRDLLHGGTPIAGTGREKEIIMFANMPDWFRFSQPDKALIWRDFRQALEISQPDIVHFHHYLHLGLECIREVRNFSPQIKILLTLHEYYGLCHNQGQMVKTDRNLCYESSPDACANCFSQYSAQDFMLRKLFIKSHFDLVDHFISPSEFLKSRYIAWGLAEERISVIENLLDETPADTLHGTAVNSPLTKQRVDSTKACQSAESQPIRFAFFGQINWFKGLDLLLDAVSLLPSDIKNRFHLDIHGSGLEHQPVSLRQTIEQALDKESRRVHFHGAYTREELPQLMRDADWMIVPSRWWENSPMVILEASKYGLPIICSNIGGMAEKICHGQTGLHFQARRVESLARTMIHAINHPEERAEFSRAFAQQYNPVQALDQHKSLYRRLLSAGTTPADPPKVTSVKGQRAA